MAVESASTSVHPPDGLERASIGRGEIVIALSLDPRLAGPVRDGLVHQANEGFIRVTGSRAAHETFGSAELLGPATAAFQRNCASRAFPLAVGGTRPHGGPMVAPAGWLRYEPVSDRLTVEVDDLGIRHMYYAQGHGWVGVSTSSVALRCLMGSQLDEMAIGAFVLTGSFMGSSTPFVGVHKLQGATVLTAHRGRATWQSRTVASSAGGSPADAVLAGARAIGEAVGAGLDAAPDAAFDLSGGLDSRMILAAVPPGRRAGMRAFTVGDPHSDEVTVARQVAAAAGLRHHVVDTTRFGQLDIDEATSLIRRASRLHDHSGNALAAASLLWAEDQLEQCPRFTGQNGEFARGFYYPGQRERPRPTPGLVTRLAEWRLFANDRVDVRLFDDGFLEASRDAALNRIRTVFETFDTTWLRATDEYYLAERMGRWVGADFSSSCTSRAVLAPFFHPVFLDWARACTPAGKRNSVLFARVLDRLDPGLAAIPLAGRPAPHAIGYPGVAEHLHHARSTGQKLVRKVRQRIVRTGRQPAGTADLARLQQEAWARDDGALTNLQRVPFLDADEVAAIRQGERAADAGSVAFLVALDGMVG